MPVLHYAIEQYNTRQVELLTALGTNVNQHDSRMRTPLELLCDVDNQQLAVRYAKILLDKGALAHAKTTQGNSVFYYACVKQRTQLVKVILREREVNLLEIDNHGNTSLHHAVAKGNKGLTHALVSKMKRYGISVDAVNNNGETAMMVAAKLGYSVCVEVLKNWGKASETMRDDKSFKTAREWKEEKTEMRMVKVSKRFRERFPEIAQNLTTDVILKNPNKNEKNNPNEAQLPKIADNRPSHSGKPVKQVLPQLLNVYKEQCASSYRPSAIPPTPDPHTISVPGDDDENWCEVVESSEMKKSRSFDSIIGKVQLTPMQRALAKTWAGRFTRKMSFAGFPMSHMTTKTIGKHKSIRDLKPGLMDLSRGHTFPTVRKKSSTDLLAVIQRKD